MASRYVRVSPGVYRDSTTGKTINSATDPNKGPAPKSGSGSVPGTPGSDNSNKIVSSGTKLDSAGNVINTGYGVGKANTQAGNQLNNPNITSAFGGQNTTYDANGQPTVNYTQSTGNTGAINNIQGSAGAGSNVLGGLLGNGGGGSALGSLFNPSGAGGVAPQSNYENSIFQQLTQGLDAQRKRDTDKLQQNLVNSGNPVGSPVYDDQMKQLNDRYDQTTQQAKGQAVSTGTNTALSAINPLSALTQSGYMQGPQQGFQGTQFNGPDVNSIFNTLTGQQIAGANNKTALGVAGINAQTAKSISQGNLGFDFAQLAQQGGNPAFGGLPPGASPGY